MKKILFVTLISILAGLYSCKKDHGEPLPGFPVTYKSYRISEPQIKVYTRDGQIDIPIVKDAFIKRYRHSLSDLVNVKIDQRIVATYLSEDSVLLTLDREKEQKARVVRHTDEYAIWEKQDTASVPVYHFNMLNVTAWLPLYYEEFMVPRTTGYEKTARYKDCFYAGKNNNEFRVPMFDFVYIDEFGLFPRLGINNKFNESCLSSLGSNDTILIQEFYIDLKEESGEEEGE